MYKNILLLKGHSAGIGDILRSSAAWRALKTKFPNVKLNLVFLSNDMNYPSLQLIKHHHLLDGFYVLDKNLLQRPKGILENIRRFKLILEDINPDLIIDFEPYGLETTILSLVGRLKYKIKTIGVNEVPPRGLLYSVYSPSIRKFAKKHNLEIPINYTDRDFVVLDALNIKRGDIQIEIKETEKAKTFRKNLKKLIGISENTKLFGVNIGCGTPDAIRKRPDFELIQETIKYIYYNLGLIPVLFGAPFEKSINQSFIKTFKYKDIPIYDIAGKMDILELVGAINAMELFVSSDSGPYHIAVALRKPNVAIFNFENREHYHYNPWTRCVVAPNLDYIDDVKKAINEVLSEHKNLNVP